MLQLFCLLTSCAGAGVCAFCPGAHTCTSKTLTEVFLNCRIVFKMLPYYWIMRKSKTAIKV